MNDNTIWCNDTTPIWCKCRFIDGQRIICEPHEINKLREEVEQLKSEIKRLRTVLNQYSEDEILCTKDAEINRLTKAELAAHRRYHAKVGCPGGAGCYVCALEVKND